MAKIVYVLGAGFGCSVVDPTRGKRAPLARNFFQVLVEANRGVFRQMLDGIRRRVYVDVLLAEIQRTWHLNLDQLAAQPFDIEECMTLFESELLDRPAGDRSLTLLRAQYALRSLLLMYLSDLSLNAYTPSARRFGQEVMQGAADVISFNYDTLAEEAIASSSGIGPKPQPSAPHSVPSGSVGGARRWIADPESASSGGGAARVLPALQRRAPASKPQPAPALMPRRSTHADGRTDPAHDSPGRPTQQLWGRCTGRMRTMFRTRDAY
ncbi:MAG: hypothetical protein ACYDA0_14605 [Candidatus Dormibacteraceae bacterium]